MHDPATSIAHTSQFCKNRGEKTSGASSPENPTGTEWDLYQIAAAAALPVPANSGGNQRVCNAIFQG